MTDEVLVLALRVVLPPGFPRLHRDDGPALAGEYSDPRGGTETEGSIISSKLKYNRWKRRKDWEVKIIQ